MNKYYKRIVLKDESASGGLWAKKYTNYAVAKFDKNIKISRVRNWLNEVCPGKNKASWTLFMTLNFEIEGEEILRLSNLA